MRASKEKFIPYVIETAVGCDRLVLLALCDAYRQEDVAGETRVVLKWHPLLAPVTVAVLPLSKKPHLKEVAHKIYDGFHKDFILEGISVQ